MGDVRLSRGLQDLFSRPGPDPPVLGVVGQRSGLALAQRQRRGTLPLLAEPHRLKKLHIPLGAGDQARPSPVLHRLELLMIKSRGHLDTGPGRVVDDVREVRVTQHRRLVYDNQVAAGEFNGTAGTAAVLRVAKELGEVVALGYSCLYQHVAGCLRRRDPNHPAPRPGSADLGEHTGLARPGRADDHLDAAVRGQHMERGSRLIHPQSGGGRLDLGTWRLVKRGL